MDGDRKREREGVRAWHIVLGIVGTLVVLIILFAIVQRSSVERRLAALRAQGQPTSLAELAEKLRLPDGVENAADTYVHAFNVSFDAPDAANTPYVSQGALPPRGVPLPEAMALATEQFLADNQECLELLTEAAAIEHCRYDWDYGQIMPYYESIRHCSKLLASAVLWHGYEQDGAAVVAHFQDGLRLAESLRDEPFLVSYLVRVACTALSLRALERTLSVTSFTDEQLAEMDRLMAEAGARLDFTQAMINERCFMIAHLQDPSSLRKLGNPAPRIPVLGGIGLADILDYMDDTIEAPELPPAQRPARFREIEEELEDLSFLHVVVKVLAPALGRVADLDLRCRVDLELARTTLAIERYRLATGAVPDDLEALVPDYLDQVPIDLQDGRPVRYQRTESGYRVYSVFEDGQDHGGVSREEVNRGDPYDWSFIVVK